jgi:hypothetical protein
MACKYFGKKTFLFYRKSSDPKLNLSEKIALIFEAKYTDGE